MTRYKIHKATHKFFRSGAPLAVAIGQKRGSRLWLNRLDSNCDVAEMTRAIGSAADHLTGYGEGVAPDDRHGVERMQSAWLFIFGPDFPAPDFCEIHKESES